MPKTQYLIPLLLILLLSVTISCKKNKAGQGTKTSAYNDQSSHNVGTACMSCHGNGGDNPFWWTVAGTVYKPDTTQLAVNSTIYLYTKINGSGTVVVLLPVDAKGNFYTTSYFDFGDGLYPQVKSPSGEVRYMQSSTKDGNCNNCHNHTRRIIVN